MALTIYKDLYHKLGMGDQYGNLGNIYEIQGDLGKATEYWLKALALYTEIGAAKKMTQVKSSLDGVTHHEIKSKSN